MSPAMAEIYQAITELMDACIKELRKSNKIDASQLTIDKGIFRSFDEIIRRQLDSVWHTVNPRTKQAWFSNHLYTAGSEKFNLQINNEYKHTQYCFTKE